MRLNNHAKIAIGWLGIISAGLYGFVLSKQRVETHRYESMKVRERMRQVPQGDLSTKGQSSLQ